LHALARSGSGLVRTSAHCSITPISGSAGHLRMREVLDDVRCLFSSQTPRFPRCWGQILGTC
jgi:hypothetical protein